MKEINNPRTDTAADVPMLGCKDLLDYRTRQVEALYELCASFERELRRLRDDGNRVQVDV